MRLHLGCGLIHRPGWVNLDRYQSAAADLLADALRLPFADASAACIESCQLVEHLGYVGTLYALYEWARVLQPGGRLLLETPDRPASLDAARDGEAGDAVLPWLFGMEISGQDHHYLFAADELSQMVRQAGFEAVEVSPAASQPAHPTLRITARRAAPSPAGRFLVQFHRRLLSAAVVDPADAPPHLAVLETLARQASDMVGSPSEENLLQLVSLSARYSPQVAACLLEALPDRSLWPAPALAQVQRLLRELERERFPARLACRWRMLPKLPGTAEAAWGLLERQISLYLAARLCPGQGLDGVRADFEVAAREMLPSDLEVGFFSRGALRSLAHRLSAQAVRSFSYGKLEKAAQLLESALGYDPGAPWPRWNLARLSLVQGRRLDALALYEALQGTLPVGLRPALEQELDAVTGRTAGEASYRVPLADLAELLQASPGLSEDPEPQASAARFEPIPGGEALPVGEFPLECCVWELTLRCNLRCLHCGATAGRPRPDELSTAEALHVADALAALPAEEVTLMGGELFLRPDWLEVAGRLRQGGVQLVVFTNATLLNPERVAQLRSLEPRSIGTSLDGGRAEVHDGIRGLPGAFERTLAAIDALHAAGLRVGVITTLTRRNLYELPGLARLLAGRDIRWQIQVAGAGGERLADRDLLNPLEFYWAALFIARMRATYPWSVLPVIGAHDIGYCSGRLPNLRVPGQTWAGCPAGRTVLGIRSDGRVQPCLSLPEAYVVGGLREHSLAELWTGPALAPWRRPAVRYGFCAQCPQGESCEGGCTGLALTYSGRRGDDPMCLYRIEQSISR